MAKFWDHYNNAKPHIAGGVDDVRHKLVEEAWFGKKTTGDIAPPPQTGHRINITNTSTDNSVDSSVTNDYSTHSTSSTTHNHATLYDQVWGPAPKTSDVYGHAPAPSAGPEIGAPAPAQKEQGVGPDF